MRSCGKAEDIDMMTEGQARACNVESPTSYAFIAACSTKPHSTNTHSVLSKCSISAQQVLSKCLDDCKWR